MTSRLRVDHRRCYKSGECYYNHPELLRPDADGFPVVRVEALATPELKLAAEQAVEVCPAQALALVEDAGA